MIRWHLLTLTLLSVLATGCSNAQAPPRPGDSAVESPATVGAEPDESPPQPMSEGPAFPAPEPSSAEPRDEFEPATTGGDEPPLPADEFPSPMRADPPSSEAFPDQPGAAEPVDANRNNVVQVFYATDRKPHLPVGSGTVEWSLYFPALAGVVVTLLFMVLAFQLRRKVIVTSVAALSFGITAYLGQQLLVRMQQVQRAADFGDRTYGENRHEERGVPVLELGVCDVSIPPDHRVGHVESPSILRLEFREDPERHVILERTFRLESDAFYDALRHSLAESDKRQAFVFIHGYNVGFDSAVKRTAQIAFDLKFDGAAICYSWPSNAGLADYTQDEANVGWTVTQLETFLQDLAESSGAKTIHLVAHSMGNRALSQAIERMSLRGDGPMFGQVILAAPDVDTSEFRNRYAPALAKSARRVTLYASSNDRALRASTKVHGYSRAGLSGENLTVTPGVDTVDVSPIDTSLIGHSYYGDNPLMIRDLTAVVDLDLPADGREWLQRSVLESEEFYWAFRRELDADSE